MNNKIIAVFITIALVIGGGAFYGGIRYDQSKNSATTAGAGGFANLSPEERQARMQQFGGGNGGRGGRANGGGAASGEILSKDDKSVTIKLRDGGSKIVFFSGSTSVMKSVEGSLKDLAVGEQVMANGSPNSDGSISAQSIQIRPISPSSAPSASRSPVDKELTITGQNYSFSPASLTVKKGDKVRIIFKNTDGFHDLKIDEFNVATEKLQAGQEGVAEFTADKTGSFEYYCSIGNHRAMGMKGVLTVQ